MSITTNTLPARLNTILARIAAAEQKYQRPHGSVTLLPISKQQPIASIIALNQCGLQRFGENRVQEALTKIYALASHQLEWHFVGAVQTNKTKEIATNFAWLHSLASINAANRLNAQRPAKLPPLNVCIQVNVGSEPQKHGITPAKLTRLAAAIAELPRLQLRGLMCIPPLTTNFSQQRKYFAQLRELFEKLQTNHYAIDTLSMGMSADLEAAIAEGSTMVRIGTALFGERH